MMDYNSMRVSEFTLLVKGVVVKLLSAGNRTPRVGVYWGGGASHPVGRAQSLGLDPGDSDTSGVPVARSPKCAGGRVGKTQFCPYHRLLI